MTRKRQLTAANGAAHGGVEPAFQDEDGGQIQDLRGGFERLMQGQSSRDELDDSSRIARPQRFGDPFGFG